MTEEMPVVWQNLYTAARVMDKKTGDDQMTQFVNVIHAIVTEAEDESIEARFQSLDADERLQLHLDMLKFIRDDFDEYPNSSLDSRPTIDDLIGAMEGVIELEETVEHYYEDRVAWVVSNRLEFEVMHREGKTTAVDHVKGGEFGTFWQLDSEKVSTLSPTAEIPDGAVRLGTATEDGATVTIIVWNKEEDND